MEKGKRGADVISPWSDDLESPWGEKSQGEIEDFLLSAFVKTITDGFSVLFSHSGSQSFMEVWI